MISRILIKFCVTTFFLCYSVFKNIFKLLLCYSSVCVGMIFFWVTIMTFCVINFYPIGLMDIIIFDSNHNCFNKQGYSIHWYAKLFRFISYNYPKIGHKWYKANWLVCIQRFGEFERIKLEWKLVELHRSLYVFDFKESCYIGFKFK